jgi:malate dehydrogenase
MQRVAIIGAGELAGATAHVLARRNVARSLLIIDAAGRIAEGKALDIAQAAPVEGFATELAGATDISMAAGADAIVVADRANGAEWQGEEGLILLKQLSAAAPRSAIVCAGALQRELVDRGVRELRLSRNRLFGSAPEALAGGARALVALALNASPRDVALTVLGVPPAHIVVPWEDVAVGGFAITRLLDEPTRRGVAARVKALWPPGPHALAAAAAKALEVMAGRSLRLVTGFVAPDLSSVARARTAAVPMRLGPSGLIDVAIPALSVVERVALDNAMQL